MRILKDFCHLENFEKFCMDNRAYCPVDEKDKGDDRNKVCHWCRVSFDHALCAYRDEILKRLE